MIQHLFARLAISKSEQTAWRLQQWSRRDSSMYRLPSAAVCLNG